MSHGKFEELKTEQWGKKTSKWDRFKVKSFFPERKFCKMKNCPRAPVNLIPGNQFIYFPINFGTREASIRQIMVAAFVRIRHDRRLSESNKN